MNHRLDNIEEFERIKKAGARIFYPFVVKGEIGLVPTRVLGDFYFRSVGVLNTPYVKKYPISKNDLILITACDGLFDVISNEKVAELTCLTYKLKDPQKLVQKLKKEALNNPSSSDNLTIIAVSLED